MDTSNLPEHCKTCWKIVDGYGCHKAENMHADTQPVEGYVADADLWCEDCAPDGAEPLDACGSNETDSPDHCAGCGVPLECTLTDEGIRYVKKTIDEGNNGCCQELWPVLFADELADLNDDQEDAVRERIEQLEGLGIPAKGIEALRKLWDLQGTVLVESCESRYTIRPRLARKMEAAGLIAISKPGISATLIARFDDLGSDMAFDLFGDE